MRRTREALTLALVELVLEKRYDAITIRDLLDKADVGRSTFYAHYRGKDDLLLQSFRLMLDHVDRAMDVDGPAHARVAPVRELFHHVGSFKAFQQALARAHMLDRQFQIGMDHMRETIARRLAARPGDGPDRSGVPLPIRAQALAGAAFALLRWWIDNDAPYTPEQMDDMYHAMRLTP